MPKQNHFAVIMAGGAGTRFWPLSRKKHPKQFIDILNKGKTLLQLSHDRVLKAVPQENIFVVTNEAYRGLVTSQLPNLPLANILCEPIARNTAPCVAYAAFRIAMESPDAVMAVLPSDHLVDDEDAFARVLNKGFSFCTEMDVLLTLGIKPTRPDTGYGYIQFDEEVTVDGIYKVKTFTEKPNQELAEHFIKSGEFLWNSGMFIWKASVILKSFEAHLPEMHEGFEDEKSNFKTDAEGAAVQRIYEVSQAISIDYGIMEKADNVFVYPASFSWSDVGTWESVHIIAAKDKDNNAMLNGKAILRNVSDCVVYTPKDRFVALNGVSNLIIVEYDDILLIADKSREQEIKQLVNDVRLDYGEQWT